MRASQEIPATHRQRRERRSLLSLPKHKPDQQHLAAVQPLVRPSSRTAGSSPDYLYIILRIYPIVAFGLLVLNGIIFVSGVRVESIYLGVEQALLNNKDLTDLQRQRRMTLIPLIESFLRYLLYFSAVVAILKTLDIDPTPILAGAGIVGLAVGFGAQNRSDDMVCGFFILFENYYLVGDWIEIGEAIGTVEAIDLRTTRIRHANRQQYIIRNGQTGNIVNYSKKYIYAVVEVGVAYESNLERVCEVLEDVGKQLKERDKDVLEPTRVDGSEKFGESDLSLCRQSQTRSAPPHPASSPQDDRRSLRSGRN